MEEKLKTLFECCIEMRCSDCPLYNGTVCYIKGMIKTYIDSLEERISIMQESMETLEQRCKALEKRCKALEKRNEPVKVRHLHNAKVTMHEEVTFTDECGNCGAYLMKTWKACPLCGRSVKWE